MVDLETYISLAYHPLACQHVNHPLQSTNWPMLALYGLQI